MLCSDSEKGFIFLGDDDVKRPFAKNDEMRRKKIVNCVRYSASPLEGMMEKKLLITF